MDDKYLLVFNAGSSSLKFEIFEYTGALRACAGGAVRDIGRPRSALQIDGAADDEIDGVANAGEAAAIVLERAARGFGDVRLTPGNVAATGHRVVHGGGFFSAPVRITVSAFDKLKSLVHLAPLHNPQSLAVMEAVGERFPDVPIVAVFDTAFFHDLPESVRTYAIPAEWTEKYGIRRYGFHGIAHQYLAERLRDAVQPPAHPGRALTLHLGQGCSMTALRHGRPVETSMGFTPLEGLIMGTRPGDLDAGVLLHMARQGYGWKELEDALNRRSGLFGISAASDDVRELLALESQRHAGARLALSAFYHRLHKYLGAYAAVLGGVDAIAIGGGIGENSAPIRERIFKGLGWLGLVLDGDANARCVGEGGRISAAGSAIDVHVIPVDEEPIIAEAVWSLLEGHSADGTG